MKREFNIKILSVAILLCSLFSCSHERIDSDKSVCEVTITGLLDGDSKKLSGLKATSVDRGDAPDGVEGYTIKIENLDYMGIDIIQEDFQLEESWYWPYGNAKFSNVTEGLNRFTAESYGGTTYKGWKAVSREWFASSDDDKADRYSSSLRESYPPYSVYRDTVEQEIFPNQNNDVHFNMKPVNGRLAVVVENNKRDHTVVVSVNNGRGKTIRYNKVKCYLLNDDSPDGTELSVEIAIKKGKNIVNTVYKTYILEHGKDKTRFINVE